MTELDIARNAAATRYRCSRCGHAYGWCGGISFGAVCELGRLVREHYATAHPDYREESHRQRGDRGHAD